MRTLLAALAALVLALAGCSSPDDGGGDGTTTPPPTTTGPAPTTTTGPAPTTTTGPAPTTTPPAENTAPTATLSATTEEGTFNVTFSVDGADEDGDELTWTLDVDDDGEADYEGEELPDEVVHTYAAAGNYTANLTVSDGQDETARSVPVVIEGSGASDGFTYEEMALMGSSPGADVTGALECPGFLAGESGINCVFTEVPAGLDGLPYMAVSDVASAVVVDWWDTCDPTAGSSLAIHLVADGGPETVPDGAGCVVMASFGVPPMPVMSLAVGPAAGG